MLRGDGDGFVRCTCGARHWGLYGAAGLLLHDPERGVLLQHRAWWTHHGGTWALPGGAVHSSESALRAALREAEEEAGIDAGTVTATAESTVDHGNWRYTTVLADAHGSVEERMRGTESAELRWVLPEDVAGYPLHRDFAAAWPSLREQLGRRLVLVVDAANVVGSRPDGWWRDRAGASARLRDRLAALVRAGVHDPGLPASAAWAWWPRPVLVVEGPARGVSPADGVEVVAAERDGDSAIVEVAAAAVTARPRDHVVVVTADRELRARVTAAGAGVLGPGSLLRLLDEA
ncbi:ADP-ribose pyrophosphatase [Amycolatopsis antarctica]|uniref:ADP-ribose pyrophosphatase n=1 Tax=Amycolatopsis antarctica TaxID=1854586 RepID=A0A263D7M4_9PSEU|nr:NUDIX domain-containing protein [Amycolatopsis antarctica]OZM74534.1 ADP-ribose pyrophosphatase [Amycolatopsis antarctica]